MEWLSASLGFIKYLLTGFVMYGCFILIERARPVETHQPLKDIWFNLRWYIVYSFVGVLIQGIGIKFNKIAILVSNLLNSPYINIPAPNNSWQYILASLFYFLITDFFYYWFHRWQHTTSFLWEQHKFHHSEKSLNVTSTRRVHWLEDPLLLLFLGIPMGILFQFDGLAVGILTFIEILWLQFIHMNLRLELGASFKKRGFWVTKTAQIKPSLNLA